MASLTLGLLLTGSGNAVTVAQAALTVVRPQADPGDVCCAVALMQRVDALASLYLVVAAASALHSVVTVNVEAQLCE